MSLGSPEYKAHKFTHYRCGWGDHYPDEWRVIFATEERKHSNPLFAGWYKDQEFTVEQQQWLDDYWQAITDDSLRQQELYHSLKRREAAKERQQEVWQRVWLVRIPAGWDKEKREQIYTGAWKSAGDDSKSVRNGIAPESEWIGGHKYVETLRYQIGEIAWTSKQELLAILADRLGMSLEYATERFNKDWSKRKGNKQLFVHHGGGVWSTVHDKFTNRGKLSPEKLGGLVEKAKVARSSSKPLTERQQQIWTLFGTLPKCEPNHEDHEACPIWHHVKADPARVAALEQIQANADPEAKPIRMSLPEYCYYIYRNMRSFISDELKWPYFKLGRFRQGVNYYPLEWMRNVPNVNMVQFRDEAAKAGFKVADVDRIAKLAVKNGDAVFGHRFEHGYIVERNVGLEGVESIANREFEKVKKNFVDAVSSSLTGLQWLPQLKREAIYKLTAELVERDGCINRMKFWYAVSKATELHPSDIQIIVDHLEDCSKRNQRLKFKDQELTEEQKRHKELMNKLYALAEKTVENGCTQSEADAARAKIDELLDKHGIDRKWFWRVRELQTMQSRSNKQLKDQERAA